MDTHERILVVGGGILGVSAGYALARRGYSHVQVLDRSHLGSAATAYAAGILSLHTWHDAEARLIQRTRQLLEDLVAWGRAEDLPAAQTAWHPVGGLTVGPPERRDRLEEMRARMRRLALDGDLEEARTAAGRHPGFVFEDGELVLTSLSDGYLESTDVIELARRRSQTMGVRFREGARVDRLSTEGGRIQGARLENGTAERADRVLVAGGAWTKSLLATADTPLAAEAYRTQIATIEIPHADRLPVLHDTVHHFYARPESAGRILAGDGTQLRPFDPETYNRAPDPDFVEATAQRVVTRFRDGAEARYRTGWAGLCVGTPDRRALAGAIPDVDGLFVLTGDNGFGLMRGLALGEVAASAMAGERGGEVEGLRPDRFGWPPPEQFALAEGFSYPD